MPTSDKENKRDGLDVILLFSIAVLLVSLIVTALLYRGIFSGSLSETSGEWSAFGSFFGGIFGPLVSFVALIALLKTIRLQRQLLVFQTREFEKIYSLQEATLRTQTEQVVLLQDSKNQTDIMNYKATILRMVEQQISYYNNGLEGIHRSTVFMAEQMGGGAINPTADQLKELKQKKEIAMARITGLIDFSMDFSLKQHSSIEELKKDVSEKLADAFSK